MEHIVYVVDDDDTVRQSVVRLLESADIHALGFSSAEAFLSHPFEDLPSCVIHDMQMPTITGFDVADALKDSGREIPIIFLTGHGTIPMSVRAIKGGAYEFLTKPVESSALLVSGRLNRRIAAELGVSEITVKVHRRRVMEKMQVRSVAELVRAVERLTKHRPAE